MNIKDYELQDFVMDESFQQWSFKPDKELDHYWMKQKKLYPNKVKLMDQAKTLLSSIDFKREPLSSSEREDMMGNIITKIETYRLKATKVRQWYKVAAVLVGLFITTGIVWNFYLNQPVKEIHTTIVERSTLKGEKLRINLPDGTQVNLNSESKLIFPERFTDKERRITLIGEGYFEVVKNPARPFIISTGEVSTTVLGTSFTVRAYPHEDEIKVAVVSGKISVQGTARKSLMETKTIFLESDQMAVYSKITNNNLKQDFDYMEMVAWKDGIIYFKNTNIDEILGTLEQWYGVRFIVQRSLDKERDFSGNFKNKSLEIVLEGLAFVFDFSYEIQDKVITLK